MSRIELVFVFGMTACSVVAEPRPDMVAKVASGEISEARVSWWGYDAEDSTVFILAALRSAAPTVILDKLGG